MTHAITIEKLSKQYAIEPTQNGRYRTLRESVMLGAAAPWAFFKRRLGLAPKRADSAPSPSIWALKDVGLEVEPGETVALIGRNGAGKSTLLKVISKITEPTTGRITLRGRVASLLEVGTGFSQELTGRENIFLNGCILGMRRREVQRNFDSIVAFAGVDEFLDTPVKRYSSGMYVRLAFAVAAHLEAEILIVDEVLAVGDMEFQQKCLGKLNEVARSGRSVLFVSHNMAAVQNLCTRGVFLDKGKVIHAGTCARAIQAYLGSTEAGGEGNGKLEHYRRTNMTRVIETVALGGAEGTSTKAFLAGEPLRIAISYDAPASVEDPRFGVIVESRDGEPLFFLHTVLQNDKRLVLPQRGTVYCDIPFLPLVPGQYWMSFLCAGKEGRVDFLDRPMRIHVEGGDCFGSGRLPPQGAGKFLVQATWTTE
jgi:lipopolysaccharide transport system ATP-binding protein